MAVVQPFRLMAVLLQNESDTRQLSPLAVELSGEAVEAFVVEAARSRGFQEASYEGMLAFEKSYRAQKAILFCYKRTIDQVVDERSLRKRIARSGCPCVYDKLSLHFITGDDVVVGFALKPI